ncbi:testis-specific serine/threonine-protein kinase 3-like [Oppia nitens]|uniref:testis-specific serine/threonine-protein kinase 3-like n=1 Tax=Oppia nitens TaxID=1686743 RepID=UPI0023DCDD4E|nr:testis-specific serine/threonine-protein kinase 3-like [Oppia nitens]
MSVILSIIRCCCPCFYQKDKQKPTKKVHKMEESTDASNCSESKTSITNDGIEIPEFVIPDNYQTVEECLNANNMKLLDVLGEGAFGSVYRMEDTKNHEIKACKTLKIGGKHRSNQLYENIRSELRIMIDCKDKHKNIIKVYDWFIIRDTNMDLQKCYITMDLANGGTVLNMMNTGVRKTGQKYLKKLNENKAKHYFRQTTEGLDFLHSNQIAHKDLKLQNILVFIDNNNNTETIKLTDFGLSGKRFSNKRKQILKDKEDVGTLEYMSPQVVKLYIYNQFNHKVGKIKEYDSFKADCWALGVCLYVMICIQLPFTCIETNLESVTKMHAEMVNRNIKNKVSKISSTNYSNDCRDLILQLLEPDPSLRLTTKLVLKHKWLLEKDS